MGGDRGETAHERKQTIFTWVVVTGLSVGILLWGLLIFWTVGDSTPPAWDFGAVQDVPGESPYSTWTPGAKQFQGRVPQPAVSGPQVPQQHVDGREPRLPLPGGTFEGAK